MPPRRVVRSPCDAILHTARLLLAPRPERATRDVLLGRFGGGAPFLADVSAASAHRYYANAAAALAHPRSAGRDALSAWIALGQTHHAAASSPDVLKEVQLVHGQLPPWLRFESTRPLAHDPLQWLTEVEAFLASLRKSPKARKAPWRLLALDACKHCRDGPVARAFPKYPSLVAAQVEAERVNGQRGQHGGPAVEDAVFSRDDAPEAFVRRILAAAPRDPTTGEPDFGPGAPAGKAGGSLSARTVGVAETERWVAWYRRCMAYALTAEEDAAVTAAIDAVAAADPTLANVCCDAEDPDCRRARFVAFCRHAAPRPLPCWRLRRSVRGRTGLGRLMCELDGVVYCEARGAAELVLEVKARPADVATARRQRQRFVERMRAEGSEEEGKGAATEEGAEEKAAVAFVCGGGAPLAAGAFDGFLRDDVRRWVMVTYGHWAPWVVPAPSYIAAIMLRQLGLALGRGGAVPLEAAPDDAAFCTAVATAAAAFPPETVRAVTHVLRQRLRWSGGGEHPAGLVDEAEGLGFDNLWLVPAQPPAFHHRPAPGADANPQR